MAQMAKTWVLDTETKGTGAHVVPLEDVLAKPAPKRGPKRLRRKPRPEPPESPVALPPRPKKFKVVDVMTGLVVAEDAGTRETVDVLRRFRSVVDVDILVWDHPFDRWRRLSMPEKRTLWGFRDQTG
jgi:hypothetical protein